MAMHNVILPLLVVAVVTLLGSSFGLQYIVGDSIWSIPPTNHFYTNWSSSYTFRTGDTLYFDFDSPFYNLIEVSRGELESCTANQPYKAFMEGPATLPLMQKGVFYFICNVSNYCALGLKVSVTVEQNSPNLAPNSQV
ncbi:Blue copper protein [Abeliophyllum distichum]|uniref:Blue copper protein n=1 Tax=Abeliophyllum distichum TaxID=126358 RepID=A0ABD1UM45_9LAMI